MPDLSSQTIWLCDTHFGKPYHVLMTAFSFHMAGVQSQNLSLPDKKRIGVKCSQSAIQIFFLYELTLIHFLGTAVVPGV